MISLALLLALRAPGYAQFKAYGAECLVYVEKHLKPSTPGLMLSQEGGDGANLAEHIAYLRALSAAAAVDGKYQSELQAAADLTEHFWDATGVGGYASRSSGGRSYAENAALACALYEAANVLSSRTVAAQAAKALNFALTGQPPKQDGIKVTEGQDMALGLAPTIQASLAILQSDEGPVSDKATGFFDWVRATLRDPETKLYHPSTAEMTAPPTQADTALMIECAARLFKSTHEEVRGEQARRMEELSLTLWPSEEGYVGATTSQIAPLLEAWTFRFHTAPRTGEQFGNTTVAEYALTKEHDRGRDRQGRYGPVWGKAPSPTEAGRLLDECTAARAFFIAAKAHEPAKPTR